MEQLYNNIDETIKSSVDKITLDFNKDHAWARLKRKRTKNKVVFLYIAVAASFILGFIVIAPLDKSVDNKRDISDFEKRQILKEYEKKISGTYNELLLCNDCSGEIIKSQIKQVPENQWILQVY